MADDRNRVKRDDEEEQEEEVDETAYDSQKDAVIFAIDVSKSMMTRPSGSGKTGDTDSALIAALKCACQIMQQRIISQPRDLIGILLFGTEKTKHKDDDEAGRRGGVYPHCYLLTDLDRPAAQDIKALKRLVEEGEDPDGILEPSEGGVSMGSLLHCALQLFTTNAPTFGSRRLFIITDNDAPHNGNKEEKAVAAVRAKDLFDLDARIELFPISHDGGDFDLSKFYDDITYKSEDTEAGVAEFHTSKSGDGLTLLKSLISNINSKQTPKRSYFSTCPFEIAPGLTISIKGYLPLHRQEHARSCWVYEDGERALLAEVETQKTQRSTGRAVAQEKVRKAYKFGNEYVLFDPGEIKELKKFGSPVLRIIGFKPKAMIPMWATVKKSTFIYPSEEHFVGSTRVFSALWSKLLRDDKVGIAWHIARQNSPPVMVALIPSEQHVDVGTGTIFPPQGLWAHPLPFADDLRNLQADKLPECTTDLLDAMRTVVDKLLLPKARYNPAKYANPSLQYHYKILQALALEEEVPEDLQHHLIEDVTVPKYKVIDKRVGEDLAALKEQIAAAADQLRDVRAMKREGDEADDRPAKRPRAGAASKRGGDLMSMTQLKAALARDTIKTMTIPELKAILSGKGLALSGKKADLVERLEQWVAENQR